MSNKHISKTPQYIPIRLEFLIKPISITRLHSSPLNIRLELQKGAQYIQTISKQIVFQRSAQFKLGEVGSISLTVNKKTNMNYSVAIYRYELDQLEFQDKIGLQLQLIYQDYLTQLRSYPLQSPIASQLQDFSAWNKIKQQLSKHKVEQYFISDQKFYKILCSVEIKIDFDFLKKNEAKINKKLSNQSHKTTESDKAKKKQLAKKKQQAEIISPKSSKERNSSVRMFPPEIAQIPTIELTSKKSEIELQIKQEEQTRKSKTQKEIEMLNKNLIAKEKHLMNLQLGPQQDKRNELLSDIIEASNQGSSIINYSQPYTDRKNNFIAQIPEEDNHEQDFHRAKTVFFTNGELEDPLILKRKCSLQYIKSKYEEYKIRQQQNSQIQQNEAVSSIQNILQKNQKSYASENMSTEMSQNDQLQVRKTSSYKSTLISIIVLIIFSLLTVKILPKVRAQLDFSHIKHAKMPSKHSGDQTKGTKKKKNSVKRTTVG